MMISLMMMMMLLIIWLYNDDDNDDDDCSEYVSYNDSVCSDNNSSYKFHEYFYD